MKSLLLIGLVAGTAWAQGDVTQTIDGPAAKSGRFEVSLFPAAVQLNGKFTQHAGTFGSVTWHLRERFALQLLGGGNWLNVESGFNEELVEKFGVEAQAASSLLWTWGLFGGFEVEPVIADFAIADQRVHFGVVLSGGAGAGGTRHQLKPQTDTPPTYGDTGVRFMGTTALGVRVALGKRFTARLEVRDVAFSSHLERINGCDRYDTAGTLLRDSGFLSPSLACRGFDTPRDSSAASNLLRMSSSDILHNAGLYLGAGFVF
jgi:hypothetical protein